MPDNEANDYAAQLFADDGEDADTFAQRAFADEGDATAQAQELAAAAPPEPRPLSTPQHERPWYVNAFEDVTKTAAPLSTLAENVVSGGTSNFADEAQASVGLDGTELEQDNQGYQSPSPAELAAEFPESGQGPVDREYAAGSQFEDNRRTLEAEKLERDANNPAPALAGQFLGAGLQAAALPGAGPLAATGTAAGMTAANLMGQGSGDISERAEQAAQAAKEHPFLTGAAVAAPGALAGVSKAAGALVPGMRSAQYRNRAAAPLAPGDLEAVANNNSSLGPKAVENLGRDIESRGLHKSDHWWENLWPAKAERFYDNAGRMIKRAGPAIGKAEDEIIAAGNPEINTQPTVDVLRNEGMRVRELADPAGVNESNFREQLASGLERRQTRLEKAGPIAPEVPATQPSPDDWQQYLLKAEQTPPGGKMPPAPQATEAMPPRGPGEPVPSGKSKFKDVVDDRRREDELINWDSRAGYEGAGAQEAARRQTATGLRQNLSQGLEEAVARGEIPQQPVDDLLKANKDFSVASAVRDPALTKMMKEYGGGMGMKDMVGMGAFSAMGVPGAVAAPTAAAMKGRWPSFKADAAKKVANNLERTEAAAGVAVQPAAAAGQAALNERPPEASDPKSKEKNDSLVKQIQELGSQSWDWAAQFLD